MGQQAPKRRRIELGGSTSNEEERIGFKWRAGYTTTMDRVSSLTSVGVSSRSGFTTASSHMEVLKEQSVTCAVLDLPEAKETASKKSSKQKLKALESQGTLMWFLGKTDPLVPTPTVQHPTGRNRVGSSHSTMQIPKERSTFQRPRESRANEEQRGILPALATHRLGTGAIGLSRPQSGIKEDTRNEYVFLSSSPPRHKPPPQEDPVLEQHVSLAINLPLLPLVRPATTMHTTSISMLQSTNFTGTRKTLGVKRSMNGWKNRKGQGFLPPTIKRPN
jgi:DNA helicase-2/ATP-dependent DNA helicase PcrA